MELRYLGFDQLQNARGYRFNVVVKGDAPRQAVVMVDLALFLAHHVGIQEGPSLCARKLASDLERSADDTHELTQDDLRVYADACATQAARRLEARRGGPRRTRPAAPESQSAWNALRR